MEAAISASMRNDNELTSRAIPGWWNDEQDVFTHIEDDMQTYTTRLRHEAGTGQNYWYIQDITQSTRYGEWVKSADGTLLKFDKKIHAMAWIHEHGLFASSK